MGFSTWRFSKKTALRLAFALVPALLILILLEVGSFVFFVNNPSASGLLFPVFDKLHYHTGEFDLVVKTNNLGTRGPDFKLEKDRFRLVVIGDSFTFGWGVPFAQTWPHLLEKKLEAKSHLVEVINLGKPGGSPQTYADVAEKTLRLLKPDLTVVAVLQGDDPCQLVNETPLEHPPVPDNFFGKLMPNAAAWLDHLKASGHSDVNELTKSWKQISMQMISSLDADEKKRFDRLDSKIKNELAGGRLNPQTVYVALKRPAIYKVSSDPASPVGIELINRLASQLERMKRSCDAVDSKALVISVPLGMFVTKRMYEASQRLGYQLTPEMLTSDHADQIILQAAEKAGMPFASVTEAFRENSKVPLYYELDGHFNGAGSSRFEESIEPIIEKYVQ